jgi:hypothetical protein
LIEIELDVKKRERRGMFLMPSTNRVNSFGNKLENQIKIKFIWFFSLCAL